MEFTIKVDNKYVKCCSSPSVKVFCYTSSSSVTTTDYAWPICRSAASTHIGKLQVL